MHQRSLNNGVYNAVFSSFLFCGLAYKYFIIPLTLPMVMIYNIIYIFKMFLTLKINITVGISNNQR